MMWHQETPHSSLSKYPMCEATATQTDLMELRQDRHACTDGLTTPTLLSTRLAITI
jgi:hypothetical protein